MRYSTTHCTLNVTVGLNLPLILVVVLGLRLDPAKIRDILQYFENHPVCSLQTDLDAQRLLLLQRNNYSINPPHRNTTWEIAPSKLLNQKLTYLLNAKLMFQNVAIDKHGQSCMQSSLVNKCMVKFLGHLHHHGVRIIHHTTLAVVLPSYMIQSSSCQPISSNHLISLPHHTLT